MLTAYTDRQLLLALLRSLCHLDVEGNELDSLIYDTLNLAGLETVAEDGASSPGFSDTINGLLQEMKIKTIQELITRH
jgi:hypothetical protein